MTKTNSPTVSIVIPAYGAEKYLAKTLDSVLEQDYAHWECWVVDDCSTDGTADIIKQYADRDSRIKYLQTPENMGAFGARNLGMDHMRGRYLCFLDADDIWDFQKISTQLSYMQDKDCHITCHAYNYIDEIGALIKGIVTPLPEFDLQSYMGNTCINMDTVMIDTHKTGKLTFRNAKKREDTQFWIDALGQNMTILGMTHILASYRIHGGQISGNKVEMALRTLHLYLKQPYVSKITAFGCWFNYMINATLKRL